MGAQVDWALLARQAWVAREHAYAPYSKFTVGAALLSESGQVYSGCNVENVSFGLTICAERSAVTAAIQGGCRKFLGLAIVADTETPVVPCGGCRQFLAEFHSAMPIYTVGRAGVVRCWLLSELLPSPFGGLNMTAS
jgi:cytidine deaminase